MRLVDEHIGLMVVNRCRSMGLTDLDLSHMNMESYVTLFDVDLAVHGVSSLSDSKSDGMMSAEEFEEQYAGDLF